MVCAAATVPVFGKLITDPIQTVQAIDNPFAIILGGLTFVTATVGINIVANFISPAFDFSNVNPRKISWRMGGMIAAVGSVILMPWRWYNDPTAIHYSLGILGALIGPLFGILIAGYFVVSKQRIDVDAMYTMSPTGRYWFTKGFNLNGVLAVIIAGVPTILLAVLPKTFVDLGIAQAGSAGDLTWTGNYSWFVGCGLGFVAFALLEKARPRIQVIPEGTAGISDGALA